MNVVRLIILLEGGTRNFSTTDPQVGDFRPLGVRQLPHFVVQLEDSRSK